MRGAGGGTTHRPAAARDSLISGERLQLTGRDRPRTGAPAPRVPAPRFVAGPAAGFIAAVPCRRRLHRPSRSEPARATPQARSRDFPAAVGVGAWPGHVVGRVGRACGGGQSAFRLRAVVAAVAGWHPAVSAQRASVATGQGSRRVPSDGDATFIGEECRHITPDSVRRLAGLPRAPDASASS